MLTPRYGGEADCQKKPKWSQWRLAILLGAALGAGAFAGEPAVRSLMENSDMLFSIMDVAAQQENPKDDAFLALMDQEEESGTGSEEDEKNTNVLALPPVVREVDVERHRKLAVAASAFAKADHKA